VFVVLLGLVAVAIPLTVDHEDATGLLSFPEMAPPSNVAALDGPDASAPVPTADGLATALQVLKDKSGKKARVGASVLDGLTGDSLADAQAGDSLAPASSQKLTTTAAALELRGPGYRIPTQVVAGADDGDVVLVGAGDVTLSADGHGFYRGSGSLDDLAAQVKKKLGSSPKRLIVDNSAFTGPDVAPGVLKSDVSDGYTARLFPVMLDGGRTDPKGANSPAPRYDDASVSAAKYLGGKLGVTDISEGPAPKKSKKLGTVYSPTIERMVEEALLHSDNLLTDALGHQAAMAAGNEASFEGTAKTVKQELSKWGVSTEGMTLADGCGLSGKDRMSAKTLAQVVRVAADGKHPKISGLFSGLPVAGFSGSLARRFGAGDAGAGHVRAKTGTLTKVSSLSGMVVDSDGRLLVYSIIINGMKSTPAAEALLDAASTNLYDCGCK
jgi:D-alanyl-D-alanine carboxypeptidase/D-alanyl-D-alanine-endopeptidase (penicillin-binding protein 4)